MNIIVEHLENKDIKLSIVFEPTEKDRFLNEESDIISDVIFDYIEDQRFELVFLSDIGDIQNRVGITNISDLDKLFASKKLQQSNIWVCNGNYRNWYEDLLKSGSTTLNRWKHPCKHLKEDGTCEMYGIGGLTQYSRQDQLCVYDDPSECPILLNTKRASKN